MTKPIKRYEDYGWGKKLKIISLSDVGRRVCDTCKGEGKVHVMPINRAMDCPSCFGKGWV